MASTYAETGFAPVNFADKDRSVDAHVSPGGAKESYALKFRNHENFQGDGHPTWQEAIVAIPKESAVPGESDQTSVAVIYKRYDEDPDRFDKARENLVKAANALGRSDRYIGKDASMRFAYAEKYVGVPLAEALGGGEVVPLLRSGDPPWDWTKVRLYPSEDAEEVRRVNDRILAGLFEQVCKLYFSGDGPFAHGDLTSRNICLAYREGGDGERVLDVNLIDFDTFGGAGEPASVSERPDEIYDLIPGYSIVGNDKKRVEHEKSQDRLEIFALDMVGLQFLESELREREPTGNLKLDLYAYDKETGIERKVWNRNGKTLEIDRDELLEQFSNASNGLFETPMGAAPSPHGGAGGADPLRREKSTGDCTEARRPGEDGPAGKDAEKERRGTGDGRSEADGQPVLFFSYETGALKDAVDAVGRRLPRSVKPWLDKRRLAWSGDAAPPIRQAIDCGKDYIVLFLGRGGEAWAHDELEWILDRQNELHRTIALVVSVLPPTEATGDHAAYPAAGLRRIDSADIENPLESQMVASEIANMVISSQREELDSGNRAPVSNDAGPGDYEREISVFARVIREVLWTHRENNPLGAAELERQALSKLRLEDIRRFPLDGGAFSFVRDLLFSTGQLPDIGRDRDGQSYWTSAERSGPRGKASMYVREKKLIALEAARRYLVKPGLCIYLDGGTTTGEMIELICEDLDSDSGRLGNLTIVTPSAKHAARLSEYCLDRGYTDDNSKVHLYVPGGWIRPSTQSIVPFNPGLSLKSLMHDIGKERSIGRPPNQKAPDAGAQWTEGAPVFDVAFIGASGVDRACVSMHHPKEAQIKRDAAEMAREVAVLCDASKVGYRLPVSLIDFANPVLRKKTKLFTAGDFSPDGNEFLIDPPIRVRVCNQDADGTERPE